MSIDNKLLKRVLSALTLLFIALPVALFGAEASIDQSDYSAQFHRDSTLAALLYGHSLSSSIESDDLYAQLTWYNPTEVSVKRRGLEWWLAEALYGNYRRVVDAEREERLEMQPLRGGRLNIYGSSSDYNFGGRVNYALPKGESWALFAQVDGRMGRDIAIDGLYSQRLSPELYFVKHLKGGANILVETALPYSFRSLRGYITDECASLTNDNLYNPCWGWYDGEQRSSMTYTRALSYTSASFSHTVSHTEILASLDLDYGVKSLGRLSWYDAANPQPDYYRKLPSYFPTSGEVYDIVNEQWAIDNEQYTQISWQRLFDANSLSSSGEAHYIMEQQCERVFDLTATASARSSILNDSPSQSLSFDYGFELSRLDSRFYKQLDDLLGGSHLTDNDYYIGDAATYGNSMANDMNDPFREVHEGERFGYDYTLRGNSAALLVGFEYRYNGLSILMDGSFGVESRWRVGHYQKERFALSSYGCSATISQQDVRVNYGVGYQLSSSSVLTINGLFSLVPTYYQDLFIQSESSNIAIDNPSSQRVNSLDLGYLFSHRDVVISGRLYWVERRDAADIVYYWDDWASLYMDGVVDGISTRSVGCEVAVKGQLAPKLKIEGSFAYGDYRYDSAPTVTLYSDNDLSLYSRSQASALEGCRVGNAPSSLSSVKLSYFITYGLVLGCESSLATGRYSEPSIVRRTDRVLTLYANQNIVDEIVTQERLPAAANLSLSLYKRFELTHRHVVKLYMRFENILQSSDTIEQSREGNRVYSDSDSGYYCQPSSYLYSVGRSLYLSCSYSF